MTYYNLDLWFCSREQTLDDQGFFEYDSCNNSFFLDHLTKILNFDDTVLSFDGSTIMQGGHASISLKIHD